MPKARRIGSQHQAWTDLLKLLQVDYTEIGLQKWANMPADEYMAMVQDPNFLGDPCVMTQHLVGATYYERVSDTEAIGRHQIRAAHQVYTAPDLKTVRFKGHAHASNVHKYRKIDGIWKLAGIKPTILWSEYDFRSVWNRDPNTIPSDHCFSKSTGSLGLENDGKEVSKLELEKDI